MLFVEMEPWLRISTGEDINAEQFFAASTYRLGGPPPHNTRDDSNYVKFLFFS